MSSATTFRIPMHRGGSLVSLEAILEGVDGTGLEWHLLDIQAIAKQNSGLDVLRLEEEVRGHPGGLVFADLGLRALARQIDQVIDCEILGVPVERPYPSMAEVSIVASDSTEWILRMSGMSGGRFDHASPLLDQPC